LCQEHAQLTYLHAERRKDAHELVCQVCLQGRGGQPQLGKCKSVKCLQTERVPPLMLLLTDGCTDSDNLTDNITCTGVLSLCQKHT